MLVNLNHFRLLRVVGRGAFGKVRIVERKDTSLSFALKYIRKDEGTYKTHHPSMRDRTKERWTEAETLLQSFDPKALEI